MKEIIKKIQKWYRKANLIFNDEETKKLESDIKQIKEMAETAAQEERRRNDKKELDGNTICPACRQKTTIVNRIHNVQGEGHVSGSFHLGYGSVSGSSSIKTGPVNHCNGCGNEWEKVDYKYVDTNDIITEWIWYIIISIEGEYKFGDKAKDLMVKKGFYAESFYLILIQDTSLAYRAKEAHSDCVPGNIIDKFKTIFPSVYE